jgi:HSP20 family protein
MITRFTDPFRDLPTFQKTMTRLFNEPFGSRNLLLPEEEGVSAAWTPVVDVEETKDHLIFNFEVPGFKNDEIKLNVENGVLTLEGERKFEKEMNEKNYHRVERSYGRFYRSFALPANVDVSHVNANLAEGVLRIELPKKEEAKPKSILIGTSGGPKSLGASRKVA